MSAKKDPTMKMEPIVKEIANFCGTRTITGKNIKNAMNMKKDPAAIIMKKAVSACLDGTNDAADCTFAGSSRTLFVTLQQKIKPST